MRAIKVILTDALVAGKGDEAVDIIHVRHEDVSVLGLARHRL